MDLICVECMIWWDEVDHGGDCPECGLNSFLMMRPGDIGTAIYFDQEGLSFSDIKRYEPQG